MSTTISNRKKIVHICTDDSVGGASVAVGRLHREFLTRGWNSILLVKKKSASNFDPTIVEMRSNKLIQFIGLILFRIEQFILNLALKNKNYNFSTNLVGSFYINQYVKDADVLNLTWVNGGFLSLRDIAELTSLKKIILWRMSDLWPVTGGCHYSLGCNNFIDGCKKCPLVKGWFSSIPGKINNYKSKKWETKNINFIAPSSWMERQVKSSPHFKSSTVKHILTGIDISHFKRVNGSKFRSELNLKSSKKIFLIGGNNPVLEHRKGWDLAEQALIRLHKKYDFDLVVFGGSARKSDLPFETHFIGRVEYENLPKLYSACDVFLAPSREENYANTVIEAIACKLPVVAFEIGGMPDAILHKESGYLAKPFEVIDYCNGMEWALGYSNDLLANSQCIEKIDQKNTIEGYLDYIACIQNQSNI